MHLPRILGGALAAALLIAPAAHADVLDQHDGVHITARDGQVLWNRYEQGHYGLMRADGTSVNIRTSKKPFDVSLGTDADGRLRAVYSRDNHTLYALDLEERARALAAPLGREPVAVEGRARVQPRLDRLRRAARRRAAGDRAHRREEERDHRRVELVTRRRVLGL